MKLVMGETRNEIISSLNNIGVAELTFKGVEDENHLDVEIKTDSITGEYKVNLVPVQYYIKDTGLKISNNEEINILNNTETLDYREVPLMQNSMVTTEDDEDFESEPYHYVKSFKYDAPVELKLLRQDVMEELVLEDVTYNLDNNEIPLYQQGDRYTWEFETAQYYINYDNPDLPIETKEFFTDGNLLITNNLADDSTLNYLNNKYNYVFTPNYPNITENQGFAKSVNVEFHNNNGTVVNFVNEAEFKKEGVILGYRDKGAQIFTTVAPEFPDVILRDPPGSNSFATIEAGSTITSSNSSRIQNRGGGSLGYHISVGKDFKASSGTPFFKVDTELDVVADTEGKFTLSTTSINSTTTVNSYTFSNSISTSDDPDFVGANGDLYIGNSKNVFYTEVDDLSISENEDSSISFTGIGEDDMEKTFYIKKDVNRLVIEQPGETFFIYSQQHVLDQVIPGLINLSNSDNSSDDDKEFYKRNADAWQKIIQENERSKSRYLKNSANLVQTIKNDLESETGTLIQLSRKRYIENNLAVLIEINRLSCINNSRLFGGEPCTKTDEEFEIEARTQLDDSFERSSAYESYEAELEIRKGHIDQYGVENRSFDSGSWRIFCNSLNF